MTNKEFIQNLDFEYLATFSLLREVETKEFVAGIQAKAKTILNEMERKKLIDLTIRGTKKQLAETGKPHTTAQLTNRFKKSHPKASELLSILSLDYVEHVEWMCAPVFREMIVFYDSGDSVVSILNICLSCDQIVDDEFNSIKTDPNVFDKLRTYFKSIGHTIEKNPR